MKERLYVVYYGDDEPEFFADPGDGSGRAQAIAAAEQAVKDMFDPQTLQYGDDVEKVFVAEVIAFSHEQNRVNRPPKEELDDEGYDAEGIDWSDGQEYICDYGIALLPEHEEPQMQTSQRVH